VKKLLFSLAICFFLIICFTPIFVGYAAASNNKEIVEISSPTPEPVKFSEIHVEVSSLGTFLRVNPYDGQYVQEPTIIDLEAEGLNASQWISIKYSGEIYYEGHFGIGKKQVDGEIPLIGVFSSTSELKSTDDLNRVPGAIKTGPDYQTEKTLFENLPTDISEDFIIRSLFANNIEIPRGAKYLFLCYADIYYPDNIGTIQVTINKLELYQGLMPILAAILTPIAIIVLIAVWLITRPPKPSIKQAAVEAHLLGTGDGKLALIDNTLTFQTETGNLRKQTETLRQIPTTKITSMNRAGNEITIKWEKTTDTYLIEEAELAGSIFETIPQTSNEQARMFEYKEATKQKPNKLTDMLNATLETVDSLFDILRNLIGWTNWNQIEATLKRSEETTLAKLLKDQNGKTVLDFTKLSTAIKQQQKEQISKETSNLLKLIYDYVKVASTNESEQIHPNIQDAKTTIQAYYLLNDIILGLIIGVREEKEINALTAMLENLPKKTGNTININALKKTIYKISIEQEKEKAIKESRSLFRKQLEDYKKTETSNARASILLHAKKIFRIIHTNVWVRMRSFFGRISNRTRKMK